MSPEPTAAAAFPLSYAGPDGRTWHLIVRECADGRLSVSGLPADRETRLSVVMHLQDLLAAVIHADDTDREAAAGSGSGTRDRLSPPGSARSLWSSPPQSGSRAGRYQSPE